MTEEAQKTNFGLGDLRMMVNLIKVVSARGAIRPEEMAAVGELHDKLANFISQAEAVANQGKSEEAEPTEGEGENTNG